MDNQQPNSGKTDGSCKYYAFLVGYLVGLSALGSFVNDMYTPSLPAMTKFFGATASTVQLGLTMGMIGLGLGQLILGPVSDRYGRKPVLLGATSLFIIAAIVSTFSRTIGFFLVCRLVQGIGASAGYFLARSIPVDLYTGRPLAKLMAIVGAINGFAPASAPVIGGITADAFDWQGVFWVLAAFAGILLCLSPLLKESLPADRRSTGPWTNALKIYGQLLRNRPFMIHVTFKGVSLGLLFAYISATPFIFQDHYGLSQTSYGLVMGLNGLFSAIGSMISLRFHPFKKAASAGAVIVAVSMVAQAGALWFVHSLWLFEILMIPAIVGLGMIFAAANTLAMNEGREHAGEASAILGVMGYIAGAIVAPIVGIGNILHSTALMFLVCALCISLCAIASARLAPDLERP